MIQRGVLCLQLAALLLAQGLCSLPLHLAGTAPHESLDSCALHQCGCDPDRTKRKNCCCYPDRAAGQDAATERSEAGVLEQLLASAHCNPSVPAPVATIAQFEFATDAETELFISPSPGILTGHAVAHWPSRLIEPPEPPPRAALPA